MQIHCLLFSSSVVSSAKKKSSRFFLPKMCFWNKIKCDHCTQPRINERTFVSQDFLQLSSIVGQDLLLLKNGFANLRHPPARGLGLSDRRLVLRPLPGCPGKHLPLVHMALPSRHALCHSSGKFCHFFYRQENVIMKMSHYLKFFEIRINVNNVGKNEYSSLSENKN